MNSVAWSEGAWTREPVSQIEEGAVLTVEAAAESDWWRTTSYGSSMTTAMPSLKNFPTSLR